MNKLELLLNPYPALRVGGEDLTEDCIYSESFMENVSKMFSMMYYRNGIGLAAPQVGWNVNLFVVNLKGRPFHGTNSMIFINPKVTPFGEDISFKEGCLSIPGIEASVIRPEKVLIEYMAVGDTSKILRAEATGLLSRVIQHEYDHLNGELFIDKLSRKEKRRILPELKQQARNAIDARKKKIKKLKKSRGF